jgi:hypothetical protein
VVLPNNVFRELLWQGRVLLGYEDEDTLEVMGLEVGCLKLCCPAGLDMQITFPHLELNI